MMINKNGEPRGSNVIKEAGPAALDPHSRLAAALLKHTAKEAQGGDLAAAEWLLGDLAAWLCDLLELDSLAMQEKARRWLKKPSGKVIVKCIEEVDRC